MGDRDRTLYAIQTAVHAFYTTSIRSELLLIFGLLAGTPKPGKFEAFWENIAMISYGMAGISATGRLAMEQVQKQIEDPSSKVDDGKEFCDRMLAEMALLFDRALGELRTKQKEMS